RVLCSASCRRLQASSLRSPDGRVPIQRNSDVKFSVSFVFFVVNFTAQYMQEERKTPEMRAQMTDIERLRHSTAHVLATAILKIWPEAQFAAGPPVDNGFYYDVDLPHRISPEDFEKIEAEMKKEI